MRNATLLLHDPRFLGHHTGDHPEHPSRYRAIMAELARRELLIDRPLCDVPPATDEQILRAHDAALLAELVMITRAGGAWINSDTLCGPDSLDAARFAAGAAISGVDAVLDASAKRAFALGRPPGHHATADMAMGFCLLNSIAIAAAHAIERGADRIAIIDWDVHHGNGTQDNFYDRSDVLYCSVHQSPWFPGTGHASEIGSGNGIGTTVNVPLPAGSSAAAYQQALTVRIAPAVRAFKPDLILISAGFDAHRDDPLGQMVLTDSDFLGFTRTATNLADELTDGKIVFVLEGGYNIDMLARNVANTVEALDS